jgi:hypothetical protein
MDKWEYRLMVSTISGTFRTTMSPVWEVVGEDGMTDMQRIQKWGAEGWELVNTIPIASGHGNTHQISWMFKRRQADATNDAG